MPAKGGVLGKSNIDYMAVMKKKYIGQEFDSYFWDVIVVDPTTKTMFSRHQVETNVLCLNQSH